MCFLYDCISVLRPGEIFGNMHAQEFEALDPFHHRPVDIDGTVGPHPTPSKVHNQFLGFAGVESQVIVLAPFGQSVDLPSVL